MYYYIIKATSKIDGSIIEYLYNEAIEEKFDKVNMNRLVSNFIREDFKKNNLKISDYTLTKKIHNFKDFRDRYESLKFVNNITVPPIEVDEELKQSAESKAINKIKCSRRYNGPRLPSDITNSDRINAKREAEKKKAKYTY